MYNLRKYALSSLICGALFMSLNVLGQEIPKTEPDPPKNWHQMDLKSDGFYGISLNQAYQFLKGKKSKTVIVTTIDSGIDTLQKDLVSILWVNPKEIPGNGIDDDHNGYVDDIHGWNFIGGKDGTNVKDDSQEEARVFYKYKELFDNKNIKE